MPLVPTNGPLNGTADRPVPLPAPPHADGERQADRLFYQELFEFAFDGQLVTDGHGVILDANQAAAALLRCPKEFLVGKPLGVLVAPGDRSTFYNRLLRPPTESTALLELRIGRPGAEPRDVVALLAPVGAEAGGRPASYRWVLRDVTGARRAEQELLWERQLLHGVVDGADAVILVVEPNGQILRSNPYLHDVTGFEADELTGQPWCDLLLAPGDRPAGWRVLGQAVAHRSARTGPIGLRTRHGAPRWVAWSARGLHARSEAAVVLIGHDVTDLQEAQTKAIQAERLAAIGQVAAGLAHESRNALQRSQACLSMLGLRLADRSDVADLLDRAQRAQDDLHRLYEGVLNYAAPVRVDAALCDLAVAWREAWADLVGTAGWGEAELVEAGDPADARCVADCFHLRRVFRNLFENARAALAGPLRVTVRWTPATLGGRPALRVTVRDNGPGFPPGARGRLFDAFFTTKVRGTGLGLALCKRVIDEHGGRIEAGAAGPGAEVVITLPRSTS